MNTHDEIEQSIFVGYWSINHCKEEPNQFCLWKRKKPNLIHRIMNWHLLGNKWIDKK